MSELPLKKLINFTGTATEFAKELMRHRHRYPSAKLKIKLGREGQIKEVYLVIGEKEEDEVETREKMRDKVWNDQYNQKKE